MTDQKNSNQVVRELEWLDVKEPDPSIIKIWELRGRNINKELHTPAIRHPPQAQLCVQSTVQILDKKHLSLPPQSAKVP